MLARGRIDADDPQGTELALFLAPIPIGILAGLDDGLLGDSIDLTAGAIVALGLFQHLFVTGVCCNAPLDTRHGVLSGIAPIE